MTKNTSDQNSNAHTQDAYAGVKVQLQAASLVRRAAAFSIDMGFAGVISYVLVFIGTFIVAFVVAFDASSMEKFDLSKYLVDKFLTPKAGDWILLVVILLLLLALLLASHGYFIYHEHKSGITPGKRFMGLKVISMDGGKLTLKQCIGREALRWIDCTLLIPGPLSILLTEKKQRLGDLFAGTMVIYSRALENEIHFLYLTRENYLLIESQVTVGPYTDEDASDCTQFAYQYLARKVVFDDETVAQWEKFADRLVIANADFPLHPQDKFLFVAEMLRQKSIARTPA